MQHSLPNHPDKRLLPWVLSISDFDRQAAGFVQLFSALAARTPRPKERIFLHCPYSTPTARAVYCPLCWNASMVSRGDKEGGALAVAGLWGGGALAVAGLWGGWPVRSSTILPPTAQWHLKLCVFKYIVESGTLNVGHLQQSIIPNAYLHQPSG